MARLTVVEGPLRDQAFPLGDVTVIGRHPNWDVVLPHKTVSRRHALIVKAGDSYKIQDLGSINGIFVDNQRVGEATLANGSKIKIGECVLLFEEDSQAEPIEHGEPVQEMWEPSTLTANVILECSSDPLMAAFAQPGTPDRIQRIQRLMAQVEEQRQKLGTCRELQDLASALLTAALELVPHAQRGFIILDDEAGNPAVHATRDRGGREVANIPRPPTDSMKLLQTLRAIAGSDDRGRHVALAPLIVGTNVEGVIRLDTEEGPFEKDTLAALGSLARAAGPLLHYAKTQQETEEAYAKNIDSLLAAFGGMVGEAGRLAAETARADIQHENLCFSTVMSLVRAMESKDEYTRGHSVRVTDFSLAIAEELNKALPPGHKINLRRLRYAALLHDVGKINVREDVLNKPTRLTDTEMEHVQRHPEYTKYILDGLYLTHGLQGLDDIAACHHERYDGDGYPSHRKRDTVPIESFIIAVADTFDALTSDRPYRKRLSAAEAIRVLEANAGTQLSPEVVRVFVNLFRSGKIGHIQDQHAQIEEMPTAMEFALSDDERMLIKSAKPSAQ